MGINAFGCTFFALKKKIFRSPTLTFWDMLLNSISLSFCKKPRIVDFDMNSVFSLSYKIISFVNLRYIFMERILLIISWRKKTSAVGHHPHPWDIHIHRGTSSTSIEGKRPVPLFNFFPLVYIFWGQLFFAEKY